MQSYNRFYWSVKRKSGTASVNTDNQRSKQEACFARATQVWVAVNHTTTGVQSVLRREVSLAAVN